MTPAEIKTYQKAIISTLGVKPEINVQEEIQKRVNFLVNYLIKSKAKGFVLGISGGQDSFNAGKLAQMAVDHMNKMTQSNDYCFVAMRLPYNVQIDEADAQAALSAIKPTKIVTYDIACAVDAAFQYWDNNVPDVKISDFIMGNRKARERMLAQYYVAASNNLLVVGTDHAAEAITGFFTKWGDSAADILPIYGLSKRQGREMARVLGAPGIIIKKAPTADLLNDKPQQSDEDELGITYNQIDDFLEGKDIDVAIAAKLITRYNLTQHKRNPIPHP